MKTSAEALLLDTHAWIWLNEGDAELNEGIRRITSAAARGLAFVSVMSVWEVGLLHAKQRVVLGLALPVWIERALRTTDHRQGVNSRHRHELPLAFRTL